MWRAFLASLGLLLPCTASSFPDYPILPVSDYPISAIKAGLTIAAHPLDSIKEQQTYFSAKLTPKGYLPVFIVMQNASTEGSFLVKKDTITYRLLGVTGPVASTPKTRSRAGESIATAEAITLAPTVAVMVETSVVPFNPLFGPTELFAGILISNAAEVQQNLLKKALQSKTLSPGASVRGFLYVQVPKSVTRQTIHLRIPVTRLGDVDPIAFDLVF